MYLKSTARAFFAMAVLISAASAAVASDPLTGLVPVGAYQNATYAYGTSPSATVFNNKVYVAYQSNSNSHHLTIASTTSPTTYSATSYPTPLDLYSVYNLFYVASATAPSITAWNGKLWVAYTHSSGYVYLSSSSDGSSFSAPTNLGLKANSSPTLAVFNNQLWLVFVQNGSSTTTYLRSYVTSDGSSFTQTSNTCDAASTSNSTLPEPQTGAAIGVAADSSYIWFGYQGQGDWNHELAYCSATGSTDSGNISVPSFDGVVYKVGSGVSAAVYGGSVYLNYKNRSNNNVALYSITSGGSNVYSTFSMNGNQSINPSPVVYGTTYYLTYTANSGSHYMSWAYNQ